MTSLLPEGVRNAIEGTSADAAAESFGVVTLVLLLLLLLQREVLRATRAQPAQMSVLAAIAAPLLLAVTLTIAVRVAALMS